jgi:methionyl-tRNA formyltransferase
MRVLFAGTPQAAVPSLHALLASEHEVVGVLTRPDARSGRGRRRAPSPVRAAAEQAGVPVLTPTTLRDPEVGRVLRDLAPDVCPVVAYGVLVPPDLLTVPRLGWVNLHFSVLPAWRGAAPVQRAIMAGDTMTGATTFLLEEGLDTGPVLGTLTEPVRPTDTAGDLLDRLAHAGAGLLVSTLDALERGEVVPVPQPSEGVSHAPRITVDDALVRWGRPAYAVDRQIRGCTPAPGAWTTFRGERLKVHPVQLADDTAAPLPAGGLRVGRHEVLVGTGAGAVRLGTVQPQGRAAMPAADWARGARPDEDERLGGGSGG